MFVFLHCVVVGNIQVSTGDGALETHRYHPAISLPDSVAVAGPKVNEIIADPRLPSSALLLRRP